MGGISTAPGLSRFQDNDLFCDSGISVYVYTALSTCVNNDLEAASKHFAIVGIMTTCMSAGRTCAQARRYGKKSDGTIAA